MCQEPVGKESRLMGTSGRAEWPTPALLFSVDIEPDFLLPIWNGHVSFCRGNDNRLAR